MKVETSTFDSVSHERLLDVLAHSDYIERYLNLCASYETYREIDGPRLDMARTAEIFRSHDVSLHWDKKFKVFTFDREEVAGWTWEAKLVVQRHDSLEPMLDGFDGAHSVGSTWLSLAVHAGDRRTPPTPRSSFLPPAIVANRPRFDGDMRTMQRMIPDLIGLFRWMKGVISEGWPDRAIQRPDAD